MKAAILNATALYFHDRSNILLHLSERFEEHFEKSLHAVKNLKFKISPNKGDLITGRAFYPCPLGVSTPNPGLPWESSGCLNLYIMSHVLPIQPLLKCLYKEDALIGIAPNFKINTQITISPKQIL